MAERGRFQGTSEILRFNRRLYGLGCLAIGIGIVLLAFLPLPRFIVLAGGVGMGLAGWWLVSSIVVSWWIYDASPLMKWQWIADLVPFPHPRWINFHSGLDESSPILTRLLGPPERVFDFFDEEVMTEPSILTARRLVRNEVEAAPVDFRALPTSNVSLDLAIVIFSAHEIREAEMRSAFFSELARVLKPGGRLILVEHQRDFANFLGFGPGFAHFFSYRTWMTSSQVPGLIWVETKAMTPFVKALVWEKE